MISGHTNHGCYRIHEKGIQEFMPAYLAQLVVVSPCLREFAGSILGSGTFFHYLSVTCERMNTGYWLNTKVKSLPRESVDRITAHPDMTSAVYRGGKAKTKQTNKTRVYYSHVHIQCNLIITRLSIIQILILHCYVLAPKCLFFYSSIVNNLIITGGALA